MSWRVDLGPSPWHWMLSRRLVPTELLVRQISVRSWKDVASVQKLRDRIHRTKFSHICIPRALYSTFKWVWTRNEPKQNIKLILFINQITLYKPFWLHWSWGHGRLIFRYFGLIYWKFYKIKVGLGAYCAGPGMIMLHQIVSNPAARENIFNYNYNFIFLRILQTKLFFLL